MTASTNVPFTWEHIQQKLGLTVGSPKAAALGTQSSVFAPSDINSLMQTRCKDGERTEHLTKLAGTLVASGVGEAECILQCLLWNSKNIEPLETEKVTRTCESIIASDRRNHPERYPVNLANVPLFDLDAGRIDKYISTNPPPYRWLLKDTLVLGKVGAIIALGGSSKSQLLLQIGIGVATGIPIAEHWEIGDPGGVLILFAEDDNDEIHRRFARVQHHLRLAGKGKELTGIEKRLYIFSTVGTSALLTERASSGEVKVTVNVDRIVALAAQIPDLRLIVIDPASRFRGGDENKNEDATRFVEALEKIAKATGASVLIAHHSSKASYNSEVEPNQGASRGASGLTDGLRWQMNLNRPSISQASELGVPKESLSRYVAATVTKSNYSATHAPVFLERMDDGYLSAVSAAQAQQRAEQDAIMRILAVLQTHGSMSARKIEDDYGGVKGTLNLPKERVRDMVKIGRQQGLLEGGDRKPLTISSLGADFLRFDAAPEDAMRGKKSPPRKKSQ
ncbi:MAG: hypothetical protein BWK72_17405 [Rhodoferax ferrireducens]|uniref:Primase C-terminal 1 domain-containing protein n=1 Tax=Rhodoferax ferrireducens TaxID=192843 RepID=A0A1W9KQC1_9BURK|nr:MAG: hypothetical protein BWK72_17405 [Rhodoferax ferrireducens]